MAHLLKERPQDCGRLLQALINDFTNAQELQEYLRFCPKYGNNISECDKEAAEIASRVSDIVRSLHNNWGNPFRFDWSSPSTHLTYGYFMAASFWGERNADEAACYCAFVFNPDNDRPAPFYLYMNVTTPDTLRIVLANSKKHAPDEIYIMRIHGSFVNFFIFRRLFSRI